MSSAMLSLTKSLPARSFSAKRSSCTAPSLRRVPSRLTVNRRKNAHIVAFGSSEAPAGATKEKRVKPEKEKGFVNKMRMVAMKLHTKDQAPKEGGKEAPPPKPWTPTREGYLKFLAESKAVYDTLERAVFDREEYAGFRETGLERSSPLEKDISWLSSEYDLPAPALQETGPGMAYAHRIAELARSDPPSFICHYYNFYFAHTAGGRMIGSKVSSMLLDSKSLQFYQYEGDVGNLLDDVRRKINELAESWSEEQKEKCLSETEESFKYSGAILRCIGEQQ